MSINSRLREARKLAGFETASDAARALGIPVATYGGHEDGNRGFKARSGERYAQFFRVSFEWLMTGRGEPRRKSRDAVTYDARIAMLPEEDQKLAAEYIAFLESRSATRKAG
jgi:transcriptional regulator with XRE-family HTH domain